MRGPPKRTLWVNDPDSEDLVQLASHGGSPPSAESSWWLVPVQPPWFQSTETAANVKRLVDVYYRCRLYEGGSSAVGGPGAVRLGACRFSP